MDRIIHIDKEGAIANIGVDSFNKFRLDESRSSVYSFVKITEVALDASYDSHQHPYQYKAALHFTKEQQEMVREMMGQDEMKWIMEHALDGIYIKQVELSMTFATRFSFGAYLSETDQTFWKLKFGA